MDSNLNGIKSQIEQQRNTLFKDTGTISITNVLESDVFQTIIMNCREFRSRVFTPFVTLLIFIKQVLCPDKSCKQAITDFISEQSSKGNDIIPSANTGPYSKARQRLPETTVHDLVKETGGNSSENTDSGWKIYGREVKAFDGTTVKMADSEANQAEFPQHSNQKKGAGFPIARLLVIVSLTVGTVLDYALAAYKGKGTGEHALLREVKGSILKDDIVLGDRYFPSYFVMADLYTVGADGIFRGQSQRNYDFRTGEQLGKNDHIVQWKKPQKPTWMNQETYDNYPKEITVREFKVGGNVYVTTFLNSKKYHKKELAKIYKLRWHIEINLNSIKTIMRMDMLSCKSPEMVKKEIGVHLLAYNIIRIIIAEACQKHGCTPREISFKGAIQLLNSFMPRFENSSKEDNERMYDRMLSVMVKNKIGGRPGRVEPRKLKQRKKPFKNLNCPRRIEKKRLQKKAVKKALRYAEA